ncbi:hypothetical protein WKK05_18430 [Nostoc sp. UHCC 0302]|uniref:hypothetical protein n=1 Tax=Nostoc sp. UHCC 0302 TaxID=3134896 RepID=UPI00311CA524
MRIILEANPQISLLSKNQAFSAQQQMDQAISLVKAKLSPKMDMVARDWREPLPLGRSLSGSRLN